MKLTFLNLGNQKNLITDVLLYPLKVNRDQRGTLTEVLKKNWKEVFSKDLPFAQSYISVTNPGFARDEELWHFHPHQTDRFVVMAGNCVFALYDARKNSKTFGVLNLFLMGEKNGEAQYLLLIPKKVLHGFCPVGEDPCCLLGFPTHLYEPGEEGRISFDKFNACLSDGTPFSWKAVRESFK